MDTQKLKEKIEEKYGSLDDECGCYGGNGEWLSVKNIVNLIDECDTDGELDADDLKEKIVLRLTKPANLQNLLISTAKILLLLFQTSDQMLTLNIRLAPRLLKRASFWLNSLFLPLHLNMNSTLTEKPQFSMLIQA